MQSHFQPSATSQVPKSPNYMFCLLSWISSHNCLILAASTQSCISDPTGLQRLEPHVSVRWGSLSSSKLGVTSLPPLLVTQPGQPAQDAPRYQVLCWQNHSLLFSGPVADSLYLYQNLNFFMKNIFFLKKLQFLNNIFHSAYMSE